MTASRGAARLRPPRVLAIGPFPPFVGGAAKNMGIICDGLEARGAQLFRLPTNVTRARAEHARSFAHYAEKAYGFIRNVEQIASARNSAAGATVYLVPDGGAGVAFSAAYAQAAATLFPRLVIHHRNYSHIRNRSRFMARLLTTAPDRALHVFLDPVMEERFKAVYSADIRSIYVPNAATCDVEPGTHERGPGSDVSLSIGFLSNLVEDKGFDVVAEAFQNLAQRLGPSVRFLLAGRPVGDANAARLAALHRALGDQLDYQGEVFGDAKAEFFRTCDVFVFPTRFRQEAQPNVLYEAMAGGAAIVATRWAGIPWVLDGTVCRMIDAGPGGADDLSSAVEDLLSSGELQTARKLQIEAFRAKKSDADERYKRLLDYLLGEVECSEPGGP